MRGERQVIDLRRLAKHILEDIHATRAIAAAFGRHALRFGPHAKES